MAETSIYFFGPSGAEGDPDRKDILGGKGASLAAMCRAQLPVPAGFTIATECCRQVLDADGRWPAGLEDAVRYHLTRLEEETGRRFGDVNDPLLVSVRSGAAVSMPGMMDTILNCGLFPEMATHQADPAGFWVVYNQFVMMFAKTVADLPMREFDAIEEAFLADRPSPNAALTVEELTELGRRYRQLYTDRTERAFPNAPWETLIECIDAVFNSWNNDRAITYRREHDIRGLAGTAVNVQSMFPSETSGIVFTANPNNLAADEIIIEAAYGLGEAVVSGDVHPDNFVIARKTQQIKRRLIGRKTAIVAALGDTGERDIEAACLTDEQIAELVEISLNVEEFFGKPMDIEWGRAGGKFALLQARAIRGLEIAEDVEVGRQEETHRLLELAGNARKVWVMHNLAETLRAPTPLTWDIIRQFMSGGGGFGRMYQDFGYLISEELRSEGFLELICGRIYADPSRAADLFGNGMPMTYEIDTIAADPNEIEGAPTRFDPERANGQFLLKLPRLLGAMWRSRKIMKKARHDVVERFEQEVLPPYLEWVAARRAMDLTALSEAEVLAELDERRRVVLDEFGGESLKPGFFGGGAQTVLEQMLVQILGPEQGKQLSLTLTQGLEGDSTIEQNICQYKVAHGQVTLAEFMERYGHRTVDEMELAKPRWREDPSYIRQTLDSYLDESVVSPEVRHEANAERRQTIEKELPETLASYGASCLREDILTELRDARKMVPYRETGKHYLMMGYELIRDAIMELSRRWDMGRDIFFLKLPELAGYADNREPLTKLIAARKTRWASAKQLDLARVVDSSALEKLGLPVEYDDADELGGEPIAPGVSAGVAQIVEDPTAAAGLCNDYILVCHSTDPGWTALFARARGLVVEQGGVLSHGAIVARDFGIPAVVCADATRRIAHGQNVRVDGNRGVITLVKG